DSHVLSKSLSMSLMSLDEESDSSSSTPPPPTSPAARRRPISRPCSAGTRPSPAPSAFPLLLQLDPLLHPRDQGDTSHQAR
ncbi:hypothetical protein CIB48_g8753, partial [Xylaria polymorpha]